MKRIAILATPVAALLVGLLYYFSGTTSSEAPQVKKYPVESSIPDFADIKNVKKKKQRFFEYMLPMVRNANIDVMQERHQIVEIANKISEGDTLSESDRSTMAKLCEKYKIADSKPEGEKIKLLLKRVDTVPASLILAQSANESAWGTSRFARKGNNFFGMWCFTPGCGITPKYRDEGLTHEVAEFDSVQQSVNKYLYTINTNLAYKDLRDIRAKKRASSQDIAGADLAEGLERYSERGRAYVREIKAMIRINQLQQYTQPHELQVSSTE